MAYRLKCRNCNHRFESRNRSASCPRWSCSGTSSSLAEDVVDLALNVAVAYSGVGLALDVADVGISAVSSLFDW